MWPSMKRRVQWNSTDARCRTSPSSDIDDGGTLRWASCSASRPSHFISKVIRKWSRYSASTAFSPRGVEPVSRGSSSGSTHMSGNWRSLMAAELCRLRDGDLKCPVAGSLADPPAVGTAWRWMCASRALGRWRPGRPRARRTS